MGDMTDCEATMGNQDYYTQNSLSLSLFVSLAGSGLISTEVGEVDRLIIHYKREVKQIFMSHKEKRQSL